MPTAKHPRWFVSLPRDAQDHARQLAKVYARRLGVPVSLGNAVGMAVKDAAAKENEKHVTPTQGASHEDR